MPAWGAAVKSPESPGTKARKGRPRPIVVPDAPKYQPPVPDGPENGGVTPRSPASSRAQRKLLRSLDENTPTDCSPLAARPANKHFRAAADTDAAVAAAPRMPQIAPLTKVA